MKKQVKAVRPYQYKEGINFKIPAYEAWVKAGGAVANTHYPWRAFHRLFFNHDIPTLFQHKKEARLRFVQPVSLFFDTFPDSLFYEIIPVIWDCWPCYFEKTSRWLKRHRVKTAIFTSSQTAERMKACLPDMKILYIPEGVDTSLYSEGKPLKDRKIDVLEFGRTNENVFKCELPAPFSHVRIGKNQKSMFSDEQLYQAKKKKKITIALPRSITQPEVAENIETLTQRYWEGMLSRMVMVGHAPQELVDLIGYNPVIEYDKEHVKEQILDLLTHIEDYQALVNKNRETALRIGSWDFRMKQVMDWLKGIGYEV